MTKSNTTRNRFVSFNTSSLEDVHLSGEDKPLCAEDDDNIDAAQSGVADSAAFCGLWFFISRLFGSCNDTGRAKYHDGGDDGVDDAGDDGADDAGDARTTKFANTVGIIDR